jgi:hypothetical protein
MLAPLARPAQCGYSEPQMLTLPQYPFFKGRGEIQTEQ